MGARDLSRALSDSAPKALLAVLALAAAAAGQGAGLGPELLRVQDAAVFAERRARFFERWEAAAPEARAAAARALERLRPSGSPLDAWPGLEELALAGRVLAGASLEDALDDGLARFADGVGLLVVPGAASGRAEGRGEPLVVRVHRVYPAVLSAREIDLALVWVGPSGEELPARREPFAPADFLRGFPVYVRAPIGPPGTWWLVPEVHQEGEARRGPGAPFELLAEPLPAVVGGPWSGRWRRLLELGVRTADGLGPSGWLAASRASSGTEAGVEASRAAGADAATLVVVTSGGESPESFGYGAIGARWKALAGRLSLALEVVGPDAVRARLANRREGERLFVLARGDGVSALHIALLGSTEPVDGLVLSTSLAGPGPALPAVPTLLVGPDADPRPGDADHLTRVAGEESPFLTEPRLPGLVEPWLARRLAR